MTALDNLPSEKKVWTTLITNKKYLPGLLALEYSLRRSKSKYPLVALYTDSFDGHDELDKRGIYKKHIKYLLPVSHKDYTNDPRFYDCWSKLQPFSLTEFERVCQLDSDMIVLHNMDELMDIPLDFENRMFAASHACVCNPLKKPHYPKDWIPENCAYTIEIAQGRSDDHMLGAPCDAGLAICNGGLQVVLPHMNTYNQIIEAINSPSMTDNYDFADQSLLSDVFRGRWVPLSYKYNALKTLRSCHSELWDDDTVKNIHYIINPKPWDLYDKYSRGEDVSKLDPSGTFPLWYAIEDERRALEAGL